MKKILTLITLFFLSFNIIPQTIIWSEDFESYSDGTQNTTKWTTNANNCDADGVPGTSADNYWGTRTTAGDKEFCCEDIEGLTCCGSQGASDNVWLSEDIDISGYSEVSVSIDMRAEGNMECNTCGSGEDLFNVEYRIDGGSWVNFLSICGFGDGESIIQCVSTPTGSILNIRVLLGNQANSEEYYFDDIIVFEDNCFTPLPVELLYFTGEYDEEDGKNVLNWVTVSETNNDYFLIQHSTNGFNWVTVKKVNGMGNTTDMTEYEEVFRTNNEIDYYRLKQIDFDGKWEYHPVVTINKKIKEPIKINYYDLMGKKINHNNLNGLTIKESVYQNGIIKKEKIFFH